jgi:citronellol/citronellal dehydrogenase
MKRRCRHYFDCMQTFQNKTALITGSSRGIGKAIAVKLAAAGAQVIIVAKSVTEDPRLKGTIYSVAQEIVQQGGKALAVPCDIRFEDQVKNVVEKTIETFGGIDILINNASAISLTDIEHTESKRFELMHDINVKGTYLTTKYCIPHLKKSDNPHILTISPPLNMDKKWFKEHTAYTVSKYSMSMLAIGLAAELESYKIASNTLWPKTTIATAAVRNLLGGEQLIQMSRKPEIMADAAFEILQMNPASITGKHFIDEDVLRNSGVQNFDHYAVNPSAPLFGDLFL